MLIKSTKDVQFNIFCIVPYDEPQKWVYNKFPNVDQVVIKPILRAKASQTSQPLVRGIRDALPGLVRQMLVGQALSVEKLNALKQAYPVSKNWLSTTDYWDSIVSIYDDHYSNQSLTDFFWTIFGFDSILMDSLNFINEMPEADVYHSLSAGFAGYACALVSQARKKPMLTIEQGLYLVERRDELARADVSELYRDLGYKFSESMVRTTYKYTDKIVPPCYMPHTALEKEMGTAPDKIMVIKNGIEVDRFSPGHRNGSKPVVGCFARIVPIKGIRELIRAAKIVKARCDVDFVVLGEIQDKDYHQSCVKLVNELGLAESFKMMGHVKAEEWYKKVDIFTLSSLSEGVPYALLEAMSAGLPSVCTAVGGIPEILSDGVGFAVPPGDPQALADKLCLLLENKELRCSMGKHATDVAHEKYKLSEMSAKFRALYEEMVK
jgi:glycosyltransferase involved in cell wall biosynthesis